MTNIGNFLGITHTVHPVEADSGNLSPKRGILSIRPVALDVEGILVKVVVVEGDCVRTILALDNYNYINDSM